jgi:hypothetical protein
MIDRPVHVFDDIGHLDDAIIGLSKADETHALYPVWCDCGREETRTGFRKAGWAASSGLRK